MQITPIIILVFCCTGIKATYYPFPWLSGYPCNRVDCGEEGCRLQEVQCVRAPCPPQPVCTGFADDLPVRGCPIGEPVLDTSIRDIRCSSSRQCPDGTFCTRSYGGGRCCWRGIPRFGSCPSLPKGTVGTCVEACSSDDQCPVDHKCCSNGCGHTCQPMVRRGLWPIRPKY